MPARTSMHPPVIVLAEMLTVSANVHSFEQTEGSCGEGVHRDPTAGCPTKLPGNRESSDSAVAAQEPIGSVRVRPPSYGPGDWKRPAVMRSVGEDRPPDPYPGLSSFSESDDGRVLLWTGARGRVGLEEMLRSVLTPAGCHRAFGGGQELVPAGRGSPCGCLRGGGRSSATPGRSGLLPAFGPEPGSRSFQARPTRSGNGRCSAAARRFGGRGRFTSFASGADDMSTFSHRVGSVRGAVYPEHPRSGAGVSLPRLLGRLPAGRRCSCPGLHAGRLLSSIARSSSRWRRVFLGALTPLGPPDRWGSLRRALVQPALRPAATVSRTKSLIVKQMLSEA